MDSAGIQNLVRCALSHLPQYRRTESVLWLVTVLRRVMGRVLWSDPGINFAVGHEKGKTQRFQNVTHAGIPDTFPHLSDVHLGQEHLVVKTKPDCLQWHLSLEVPVLQCSVTSHSILGGESLTPPLHARDVRPLAHRTRSCLAPHTHCF